MPTFGKRGLRSEFLITLRPLQCLDGENVVVGKIIFGYEYMKKVSKFYKHKFPTQLPMNRLMYLCTFYKFQATAKSKPIKARFGSPYYPVKLYYCLLAY